MKTDAELILHVWEMEDIKKVVAKRCYYQASDDRAGELNDLWVKEPEHMKTASFGRNWGFYVGMDEVKKYYVDSHRERLEKQMKENGETELNVGNMYAHPATTPLIVIADDGQTAKGMWYCISQETIKMADGTADARWMPEKLAIDFVKEDGQWKIWHLVVATDLNCEAGEKYAAQPVYVDWDKDPVKCEFGTPTLEILTHDATFNWWDHYPFMPEPYETFCDRVSYGPEGFKYHEMKGLRAHEGKYF
ncbi:MAG: nuclear transport factor 2 family protein [Agathobacter sp.]